MSMASLDYLPGLSQGCDTAGYNLLVRGLPSSIDEQTLCEIFSNFGDIQSCHLMQPASQSSSTKVGFVNLSSASQARDAVKALNGAPTDQGVLEVVAGPTSANRVQAPSDNLYVRNLPSSVSDQELRELFNPYGSVQECRILHRGDEVQGAGALVRMKSIDAASHAIASLNGQIPGGYLNSISSGTPLLVRYADSPEEKARKLARKEQFVSRLHRSLDLPSMTLSEADVHDSLRHRSLPNTFANYDPSSLVEMSTTAATGNSYYSEKRPADGGLDALLGNLGSQGRTLNGLRPEAEAASNALVLNCLTPGASPIVPPPPPPPPPPPAAYASLYIKNLPAEADKLWLYEMFAPFGGILSVKILQEEHSIRCRGVGFVNYTEPQGALAAVQNMNGVKVADKHLHVSLQVSRNR